MAARRSCFGRLARRTRILHSCTCCRRSASRRKTTFLGQRQNTEGPLELRPDLAGILDRIELASAGPGSQPAQSQNTFAGIRSSFASGRFQDAALEAKGLLASQPQNAEAMYWLGRAYQSLATGTVDSLTEVAPESYRVDQLAGELHEERTEYESAVAAYRRALRKAPEVPGLRYAIATSYWKMGNFTDALEWLEEELDRNPHHARGPVPAWQHPC